MKKIAPLSLKFVGGILILLFSIIGCSDTPLGSMLTVEDIDRYVLSSEDSICLLNGTDSTCLRLVRKVRGGADTNAPIIHIHPSGIIYVFYYEGKQIVRAEKVIDTTEIVEVLTNTEEDPLPVIPDPPVNTNPPVILDPLPPLPVIPDPPVNTNPRVNLNPLPPPVKTNPPVTPDPPPVTPLSPPATPDPPLVPQVPPPVTPDPPDTQDPPQDDSDNDNDDTQQPVPPPTTTERPTDSDWAQESHYYDADQSKHGWSVRVYYPENYNFQNGPRGTPGESENPDFLINGFRIIPSDGSTITGFSQTEGLCYDEDKPCHVGTPDDPANSTTYSAHIFLTMPPDTGVDDVVTFQVIWDPKAENWEGSPPPDMTYSLMASKNMINQGQEGADPDHTQE